MPVKNKVSVLLKEPLYKKGVREILVENIPGVIEVVNIA